MNRHSALIDRLAAQARPVKPLAPTWQRVLGWAVLALASGALIAMGLKHSTLELDELGVGWALADAGLSLYLGILLIGTAFETSIAGRRALPWRWFVIPILLWLGINAGTMIGTSASLGHWNHDGRYCYRFMVAASLPMIALSLCYLRRTRSLHPAKSLALAGSGIAFVCMCLLRLCHGQAMSLVDFTMHLAAASTIVVATVLLGRRWVEVL